MQSKHIKTIVNLLVFIIGILLAVFLLPKLIRFFMPFVIGAIVAWIANPMVRFFEKKLKIKRKHGTWIVIVGVLASVIAGLYTMMVWLIKSGVGFVQNLSGEYSEMLELITSGGGNAEKLLGTLPEGVRSSAKKILENIDIYIEKVANVLGDYALEMAGTVAKQLPNLLVMTIFTLLSAYFFVADKERISSIILKHTPQSVIDRAKWCKKMFIDAVGGYFKAQFKIMGVIAVLLWIGLMILRIEYSVLWALLIAFLDFLPFFGTGAVLWPWAAFEIFMGNYFLAAGMGALYLICLLAHQILQPKLVGDTVGMDPLTTMFFLFIGYRISGVFGMIIAIPVGMICINLFKVGAFDSMIADVKEMIGDFNRYRHGK